MIELVDKFDRVRACIGTDTMLAEVWHYFSADEVKDFLDSLIADYDLTEEDLANV